MFRAGTTGEFAFIREETLSTRKGTSDSVRDAGVITLYDHDSHPILRSLVSDDFEIITF